MAQELSSSRQMSHAFGGPASRLGFNVTSAPAIGRPVAVSITKPFTVAFILRMTAGMAVTPILATACQLPLRSVSRVSAAMACRLVKLRKAAVYASAKSGTSTFSTLTVGDCTKIRYGFSSQSASQPSCPDTGMLLNTYSPAAFVFTFLFSRMAVAPSTGLLLMSTTWPLMVPLSASAPAAPSTVVASWSVQPKTNTLIATTAAIAMSPFHVTVFFIAHYLLLLSLVGDGLSAFAETIGKSRRGPSRPSPDARNSSLPLITSFLP